MAHRADRTGTGGSGTAGTGKGQTNGHGNHHGHGNKNGNGGNGNGNGGNGNGGSGRGSHRGGGGNGTGIAPGPLRAPLAIYLNDHLLGATSGSELARRVAKQHAMSPAGATLVRIADEIAQDRAALLRMMRRLGIPVRRYKAGAGWLLEKAGRAKTNGFLVRRAPLSSVVELEALRLGVEGKRLMWQALRSLDGPQSSVLDAEELARLAHRADEQGRTLEGLQRSAATRVLDR